MRKESNWREGLAANFQIAAVAIILCAGLGGCVIALIRQESSDDLVKKLSASGYRSFACQPSSGSRVEFMRSCEG